jgi:hypothetical protein
MDEVEKKVNAMIWKVYHEWLQSLQKFGET